MPEHLINYCTHFKAQELQLLIICHFFKVRVTKALPILLQIMQLSSFSCSHLIDSFLFSPPFQWAGISSKGLFLDLGPSRPSRRQLPRERSHLNWSMQVYVSQNKAMFFAYYSIYSHMHILTAIIKYCCIIPKAQVSDKIKAFFPEGLVSVQGQEIGKEGIH